MSPDVQEGEVQGEALPNIEAVVAARDSIARDLKSGAVVVSARQAKLLLKGFDMLLRHIASAHEHYESDCNNVVSLRIGATMHALGATSVTLSKPLYDELRDNNASLNFARSPDGDAITYTLTFPEETTQAAPALTP